MKKSNMPGIALCLLGAVLFIISNWSVVSGSPIHLEHFQRVVLCSIAAALIGAAPFVYKAKTKCGTVLKFFAAAALIYCIFAFGGFENNRISGSAAAQEEEHWAAKPSVMIDGVLYGDTGHSAVYRTEEAPENGGHTDGEILSSVAGHEYPTEDEQSNFGTGYPYRYGVDGTVELFFDSANQWRIYEAYERK